MARRSLVWDGQKLRVLDLIFEGRLSQAKVAVNVGIQLRTLERWVAHPDFKAALEARRSDLINSLDSLPYIRKERRLIGLAQMAESARVEYETRPLLIERRPSGRDTDGEMMWMEQEAFNRDAFAAFRESLNDIAKELGERSSNVNITATQQALNVTIVMERMRNDRSIARTADNLLAQLTGGTSSSA